MKIPLDQMSKLGLSSKVKKRLLIAGVAFLFFGMVAIGGVVWVGFKVLGWGVNQAQTVAQSVTQSVSQSVAQGTSIQLPTAIPSPSVNLKEAAQAAEVARGFMGRLYQCGMGAQRIVLSDAWATTPFPVLWNQVLSACGLGSQATQAPKESAKAAAGKSDSSKSGSSEQDSTQSSY